MTSHLSAVLRFPSVRYFKQFTAYSCLHTYQQFTHLNCRIYWEKNDDVLKMELSVQMNAMNIWQIESYLVLKKASCNYIQKSVISEASICTYVAERVNPFSAGTAFMLMQTGWIQTSCRVTRQLAWDTTCLLLSPSFPIKNKQNLKVLKNRRQYNLFLEIYPEFKGLRNTCMMRSISVRILIYQYFWRVADRLE